MVPSSRIMRYVGFIMLAIRDVPVNDVDLSRYVYVSDIATAYIATTLAIPLYLSERVPDLYKTWLLEAKDLAGKYLTESVSYSDFIHKETVITATILDHLMQMFDNLDLENVMIPSSVYELFYLSQLFKVIHILKSIEHRAMSNVNLYDLYMSAKDEILSEVLEVMFAGKEVSGKLQLYTPFSASYQKIQFSNKDMKAISIRYFRYAKQEFDILLKALSRVI
jgi:hypothetical protein